MPHDTFFFVLSACLSLSVSLSVCLCVFSVCLYRLKQLRAWAPSLTQSEAVLPDGHPPPPDWHQPHQSAPFNLFNNPLHWTNTKLPIRNDSKNYTVFLIMTHNAWYHWRYCWYWCTFFPNLMNCIQHFMVSIEFIWSDRILNNSFHLAPEMTPRRAHNLCWICENNCYITKLHSGEYSLSTRIMLLTTVLFLQSEFIVWLLCWTFGSAISILLVSCLMGQLCLINCGWARDKFGMEIQYCWHDRQSKTSEIHGVMNKATNL